MSKTRCKKGTRMNKKKTQCVRSRKARVPRSFGPVNQFGPFNHPDCDDGYRWNKSKAQCVPRGKRAKFGPFNQEPAMNM